MTASKGKVIHLYQRDPQEALERLNRITGLRFSSWPQSLVNSVIGDSCPAARLEADTSNKTSEMLSR